MGGNYRLNQLREDLSQTMNAFPIDPNMVYKAIDQLPELRANAVRLRYRLSEDESGPDADASPALMPFKEVGKAIGRSGTRAKWQMAYGMAALRKYLNPDGPYVNAFGPDAGDFLVQDFVL